MCATSTSVHFLLIVSVLLMSDNSFSNTLNKEVMRAKVVSCSGCRLNQLPEVKRFIKRDLLLFHNVEFQAKPGANPDLLLLSGDDEIIERIDLSPYDQKGCNDLLKKKGFYKKKTSAAKVPDEYLKGPYVEVEVLNRSKRDDL